MILDEGSARAGSDRRDAALVMMDPDDSDEDMYALEGMYMPNPGEFPPVKFPFDSTNTVRDVDARGFTLSLTSSSLLSQTTSELVGHKKRVHTLAWAPCGKKLATGGTEPVARVWDIEQGAGKGASAELAGHTAQVEQLRFEPSNGQTLATVSADKTAKVWDVRSGRCAATVTTQGELMNVAWSPDGRFFAVGNRNDVISMVDTKTMTVVWEHKYKFEVNQMMWNHSGNEFFMATGEGRLQRLSFNATTAALTPLESHFAHNGGCYCLDISPNGDMFALGAADAIVSLWETKSHVCYQTVVRLDCPIRTVSYSHDNKYIAAASEDLFIDIANAKTGKCMGQIKTKEAINSIAFNPKELVLAYAGDTLVHLWSAFQGLNIDKK